MIDRCLFDLKVSWTCDHCNKVVFTGLQFRANYARIHLAADKTNGLCSNLCAAVDEHASERQTFFRNLLKKLEKKKLERNRKRKQQDQRLEVREASLVASAVAKKKRKMRQPQLQSFMKVEAGLAADLAVSQWAIAHSIPPNALKGPYWKRMNQTLRQVAPNYVPMYDKKLFNDMLSQLKQMAKQEVGQHLKARPIVGRTVTGDGATKGVPLINFLVHVPGKGVKLLDIIDCTDHLSEGGIKDAAYVTLNLQCTH